jgi:carboxyl-terminal processing protease
VRLRTARGRGRAREVVLVRSILPPRTVLAERREEILWIRLTGFSSATDRDLAHALADSFRTRPPRGVVLDLRGNRGGLLNQAVTVADAFLADGEVARTEGRHPDSPRLYEAGGMDLAVGRPVVVLVDGRTASAAEIVAAALGERRRAVLVGSATMGKGLIQLVAPMPNNAELLVTWSRVLAPSGFPIQPLGVLPGLCTSLGPERAALALARLEAGEESEMAAPLARLRLARAPVPASEVVALRGACPPAEGREGDLLAARRLIEMPEAYAAALRQ